MTLLSASICSCSSLLSRRRMAMERGMGRPLRPQTVWSNSEQPGATEHPRPRSVERGILAPAVEAPVGKVLALKPHVNRVAGGNEIGGANLALDSRHERADQRVLSAPLGA